MVGFTKGSAETEAMSVEGSRYSGESLASLVVHSGIRNTTNAESHLEEEPTHGGGSRGERLMVQAWSHRLGVYSLLCNFEQVPLPL